MTVQWQTRSIDCGQGLDTKTDPKHVIPGKWSLLQNAVRSKGGQFQKRPGQDALSLAIIGGGTIQNPKMVKEYNGRLVCAGTHSVSLKQRLFDYSPSASAWRDSGLYESIEVGNTFISGSNVNERAPTCAISGNYSLVSYDAYDVQASLVYVGVSILDLQTNTFLLSDFQIKSGIGNTFGSKAVLLGASTLGILYFSSNGLCLRIASIASGGVSLGAEISLANDLANYGDSGFFSNWVSFDSVNTSAGASIAYSASAVGNPIKFLNINTVGTITATGTIAAAGFALPLSLTQDAAGNLWTYWATSGDAGGMPFTGTSLFYAVVSSALASVLAKTQIGTGFQYVRQMCAYVVNSTTQQVLFGQTTYQNFAVASSAILSRPYPQINSAQVTLAGSANPPTPILVTNLDIYGKPFTANGSTYLPCVYLSPDQMTGFLLDISGAGTPAIVAKFLRNSAEGAYSTEVAGFRDGGNWWRQPGSLSQAFAYGSKFIMASAKMLEDDLSGGNGNATTSAFIAGSVLVSFDFSSVDAFQAHFLNNTLFLNGGVVSQYDGSSVCELNFHAFPELAANKATTGGFIADGTYKYQAVYQWTDSAGNVHKSTSSDVISVTLTGGTGNASVNLFIKAPLISAKDRSGFPTQIYLYRSLSTGSLPFLLTIISVDTTTPQIYYQFTDTSAGVNQAQPIYINGGEVLDNSGPPASMAMWVNNNRLNMIDSETDDWWYSKTSAVGTGISPSDQLLVSADLRLGRTKFGIGMDEKTVLGKERGFFYNIGDGADDSGNNATFGVPQIIPSDTGAVSARAVCLTADGIMMKTKKGLYLMNRGMSLAYTGADVDGFNSQDVQDIRIAGDVNQVRILTSSGDALVYDSFYRQWSSFSNYAGLSSDIWNGKYVYARADGSIFIENSIGTYLDNGVAYSVRAQTGWLKFSAVQGYQRVRRALMLGDFSAIAGHGIQISSAYDFISTFVSHIPFSFSGANGAFQYQERFPRQKCNAVQLLIEEITTGASGEYMSLSDIDIEFGIKRGLNKLSASQKVG